MDLKEKLLRQQQDQETAKQTAGVRLEEWIRAVNALVHFIRNELTDDLSRQNLIKQNVRQIRIRHDLLEKDYDVPQLEVTAAGRTVTVRPIGNAIIGAAGRVDIEARPPVSSIGPRPPQGYALIWDGKGLEATNWKAIPVLLGGMLDHPNTKPLSRQNLEESLAALLGLS